MGWIIIGYLLVAAAFDFLLIWSRERMIGGSFSTSYAMRYGSLIRSFCTAMLWPVSLPSIFVAGFLGGVMDRKQEKQALKAMNVLLQDEPSVVPGCEPKPGCECLTCLLGVDGNKCEVCGVSKAELVPVDLREEDMSDKSRVFIFCIPCLLDRLAKPEAVEDDSGFEVDHRGSPAVEKEIGG